MDRGFDPDAADPLCGSGAHANGRHAPVDFLDARLAENPAAHDDAVRTRLWSRHALRALITAWVAIASSNLAEGPGGDLEGAAS